METTTETKAETPPEAKPASEITVQNLLDAGVHFGHQTKRWNPKMRRFIFGERNGIYVIDLNKSLAQLQEACSFVYDTVVRGGRVLFVGTKKQAQKPVLELAERLKQPYVIHRWLGGMLTNNRTIRQSVKRMRELEDMEKSGAFEKMPKKEVATLRHELSKLQRNLSGVADMDSMPGAVFVVDIPREAIAVKEAVRMNIPVVAMVDTNCDPEMISYPIPSNDDAIRSIRLITRTIGESIERAQSEYEKVAAETARKRAIEEAEARARAKAAEEERRIRDREAKKAREAAMAAAKEKTAEPKAKAPAAEPEATREKAVPAKEEPATEPAVAVAAQKAQPEAKPAAPAKAAPAEEPAKPPEPPKAQPEAQSDTPAEPAPESAPAGS